MTPEPEENRLDQQLRSKFEQYAPPPSGKVWPGIAPNIGPPPQLRKPRPLPLPLLFGLTALLAGLAGWLLPHETTRLNGPMATHAVAVVGHSATAGKAVRENTLAGNGEASQADRNRSSFDLASSNSELPKPNSSTVQVRAEKMSYGTLPTGSGSRGLSARTRSLKVATALAAQTTRAPHQISGQVALQSEKPTDAAPETVGTAQAIPDATATVATTTPADAMPATLRSLAALERQTLEQLPSIATLAAGPLDAAGRTTLLTTLRTERAELLRLQRRTDSLLLALGDLPSAPTVAAHPDSAQPATSNHQPTSKKWSLLLTAAPEQNALTLEGPAGDSLTALRRNHETGRAGFSAGVLAEYRLTPRLSVGGGVGYTSFGADLRITNKTTDVRVSYDTTITRSTNVYTTTYQTHSIRIVQVPQLSPVFNGSGQVIRYDTVYVPRQDTVFTTTVQHDTTHTTNRTITPNITKKETLNTRLLQPNYRFFTVPVVLRYRLAAPGTSRLWTDVALGAQLQFFLGGTQVVTNDGENFRTEKITVASSPFRALNVALSGSLALNYALTPRLSVSVAPSMRWQALSLYKPETGLRQQPTATGLMFGVRFEL